MRNTPYVAGRRIDLVKEILPVAAPSVMKQIVQQPGQYLGQGKSTMCKKLTEFLNFQMKSQNVLEDIVPHFRKRNLCPGEMFPLRSARAAMPEGWYTGGIRGVLDPQAPQTLHIPAKIHALLHTQNGTVSICLSVCLYVCLSCLSSCPSRDIVWSVE